MEVTSLLDEQDRLYRSRRLLRGNAHRRRRGRGRLSNSAACPDEDEGPSSREKYGPPLLPHGDDPKAINCRFPTQEELRRRKQRIHSLRTVHEQQVRALRTIARSCPTTSRSESDISQLPKGFPPELAYRALAVYSFLRTMSIPLRLSPFTPHVFLRALLLPYPSRLLGSVHVALLRILLTSLKMGYHWTPIPSTKDKKGRHSTDGRSHHHTHHQLQVLTTTKKRHVDGLRYPLRAGDNLDFLDRYTWPIFYDDYCHLTADVLYAAIHDDFNFVDLRKLDIDRAPSMHDHGDRSEEEDNGLDIAKNEAPGRSRRGQQRQTHGPSVIYLDDEDDAVNGGASDDEFNVDEDEDDDDDEDFILSMAQERKSRKQRSTGKKRGRPRKHTLQENGVSGSSPRPAKKLKPSHAPTNGGFSPLNVGKTSLAFLQPDSADAAQQNLGNVTASMMHQSHFYQRMMASQNAPHLNNMQPTCAGLPIIPPTIGHGMAYQQQFSGARLPQTPNTFPSLVPNGNVAAAFGARNDPLMARSVERAMALTMAASQSQLHSQSKPIATTDNRLSTVNVQASGSFQPNVSTLANTAPTSGGKASFVQAIGAQRDSTKTEKVSEASCDVVDGFSSNHNRPPSRLETSAAIPIDTNESSCVLEVELAIRKPVPFATIARSELGTSLSELNGSAMRQGVQDLPKIGEKKDEKIMSVETTRDVVGPESSANADTGTMASSATTKTNSTNQLRQEACEATPVVSENTSCTLKVPDLKGPSAILDKFIRGEEIGLSEDTAENPGFDEDDEESNSTDELPSEQSHWRHFDPLKKMRLGTPFFRLTVEDKIIILEFLIDELLTVDSFADELRRRREALEDFDAPYGRLPSKQELEDIVNADECAICAKEGELLCCDGCISSYHRACIGMTEYEALPEGRWLCPECTLPDPAMYGPLHAGRKSSLDWFSPRDIGISALSTGCEGFKEKSGMDSAFQVVHSFAFARQADEGLDPSSLRDTFPIPVKFGLHGVSRAEWPLSQMRKGSYLIGADRYDPSFYLNKYGKAPIPLPYRKVVDATMSDFENQCGSAQTFQLSDILSPTMVEDHNVAVALKSGMTLYDPYRMVKTFLIDLELDLLKAQLLDEFWGFRDKSGRSQTWKNCVDSCSSVHRLSRLAVSLVDSMHPRAFSDNWFQPLHAKLQSVSAVSDCLNQAEISFAFHCSEDSEDVGLESLRRQWDRSSMSDISHLLAKESLRLVDWLHPQTREDRAFRNKRKAASSQKSRVPIPSDSKAILPDNRPLVERQNSDFMTCREKDETTELLDNLETGEHSDEGRSSAIPSLRSRKRAGFTHHAGSIDVGKTGVDTGDDSRLSSASLTILKKKKLASIRKQCKSNVLREGLWPVAGKRLFDPPGYLPRRVIKRLGRRAGVQVAPFTTYSTDFEVGQPSFYHTWRKRMLNCLTYEDLLLGIRILRSFLDLTAIKKCGSIATKKPKGWSIICSHEDPRTGLEFYLLFNEGKRVARWSSSLTIEFAPLVREMRRRRYVRKGAWERRWGKIQKRASDLTSHSREETSTNSGTGGPVCTYVNPTSNLSMTRPPSNGMALPQGLMQKIGKILMQYQATIAELYGRARVIPREDGNDPVLNKERMNALGQWQAVLNSEGLPFAPEGMISRLRSIEDSIRRYSQSFQSKSPTPSPYLAQISSNNSSATDSQTFRDAVSPYHSSSDPLRPNLRPAVNTRPCSGLKPSSTHSRQGHVLIHHDGTRSNDTQVPPPSQVISQRWPLNDRSTQHSNPFQTKVTSASGSNLPSAPAICTVKPQEYSDFDLEPTPIAEGQITIVSKETAGQAGRYPASNPSSAFRSQTLNQRTPYHYAGTMGEGLSAGHHPSNMALRVGHTQGATRFVTNYSQPNPVSRPPVPSPPSASPDPFAVSRPQATIAPRPLTNGNDALNYRQPPTYAFQGHPTAPYPAPIHASQRLYYPPTAQPQAPEQPLQTWNASSSPFPTQGQSMPPQQQLNAAEWVAMLVKHQQQHGSTQRR